MPESVIATITKAKGRKKLYHFTRVSNLPAIASIDALLSSYALYPAAPGQRRTEAITIQHDGLPATLNSHLRIPLGMMDTTTSLEAFRACLDQHVFLWPTLRDCLNMVASYKRREADEHFAVLELDAYSLLTDHYSSVKLSKYDSGSSPRYPNRCSYRKSIAMFLPLHQFQVVQRHDIPIKPSEIKEILVEGQVHPLARYLESVYIENAQWLPEQWRELFKPWFSTD